MNLEFKLRPIDRHIPYEAPPDMTAPVSVIIPCYRCTRTIERAVASVAAQTQRPAEVILVDDASGDSTLELLHRIAAQYPEGWIRVLSMPVNGGPGLARNAAWDIATQPYIAFLDSDNSWHRQKIEIQYRWMSRHPEAAVCGHGWERFDSSTPPENQRYFTPDGADFRKIEKNQLLISNRFPTSSAMLRRDIPIRFANKRYSEDYRLWCEIVFSGLNAYRADTPLLFFYKALYGQGGLSANLLKMEQGELETYRTLYRKGHLGLASLATLYAWSLARFAKRLIVTQYRKAMRRLSASRS
jgi:glycosyltransferase involved in cell wall biosynthesis